eukprot:366026-Chlamydomonas_euryale.AAC.7
MGGNGVRWGGDVRPLHTLTTAFGGGALPIADEMICGMKRWSVRRFDFGALQMRPRPATCTSPDSSVKRKPRARASSCARVHARSLALGSLNTRHDAGEHDGLPESPPPTRERLCDLLHVCTHEMRQERSGA